MATKSGVPPIRGKYAWTEWADGDWWTAYQITDERPDGDFPSNPVHFRTLAYRWAKRHGLKVHTRMGEDSVTFKFYNPKPKVGPVGTAAGDETVQLDFSLPKGDDQ